MVRNLGAILLVIVLIFGIVYGVYSTRNNTRSADFSIVASSPVSTGTGQTSTVLVRSMDGFNGQVALRAIPPNGVTCKGIPGASSSAVIFVPGSWTLQCKAASVGNYVVTISGTAGDVSKNATVLFRFEDGLRNTSIGIDCVPAVLVLNQTSNCHVTVTDTTNVGAKIAPTGTVMLTSTSNSNNTITISTCVLVHESCTLNYTGTVMGSNHLLINYTGDGVHKSQQVDSTIEVRAAGTVTNLACTPVNIVLEGGPATCTVTVTNENNQSQQTAPTGTVSFTAASGGTVTPSVCTLDKKSSCQVEYLPVNGIGSFVLIANYTGDVTHASSQGQFALSVSLSPTVTMLSCNPSAIMGNSTPSNCTVTVTDTSRNGSVPTGYVELACSGNCVTAPTPLCLLVGNGLNTSSCNFTITPNGPTTSMITHVNYQGDTVHASSSTQFTVTVSTVPSTVTVSGHATTTAECLGCKAVRLNFVNKTTRIVYSANVNDSTYTLPLANNQTYEVTMDWQFGTYTGSCTGAVLDLHQTSNTLTVDYQC